MKRNPISELEDIRHWDEAKPCFSDDYNLGFNDDICPVCDEIIFGDTGFEIFNKCESHEPELSEHGYYTSYHGSIIFK